MNATVLDLLGAFDARRGFPVRRPAARAARSLRPPDADEPIVPLSTASGVWEPDITRYGVIQGDLLVIGGPRAPWRCYDAVEDPTQHKIAQNLRCVGRRRRGRRAPSFRPER